MLRARLIGVALFVVLLPLSGCGNGSGIEHDALEVEEFEYVDDDGMRILRGVLVNNGDRDISSAQIEVILLDEQNRQAGTAYVPVAAIAAGERTNFRKVLDRDEEFASARVKSVLVL